MAKFPTLKTDAIAQYPLSETAWQPARVMRFLDGSEQRFSEASAPLKRWLVRLEQLDDAELTILDDFFRQHNGSLDSFEFTDPCTGATLTNCSFVTDSFLLEYAAQDRGRAALVIVENRS
jgi:hypothetical protein